MVVMKLCITTFFWIRSIPSELKNAVLIFVRPSVLSKIIFLADDEMKKVLKPDYALIEQNKNRLTFLYSKSDGWTPISYYERLVNRIPDINAQLTDKYDHAFVLKSSHKVGVLISEWIQKNMI